MVAIYCKFCENRIIVSSWAAHVADKRHMENLPSKITVKGKFCDAEILEVHEYFERFGRIKNKSVFEVGDEKVLIMYDFEEPKTYSLIAQRAHVLFGRPLEVGWFKSTAQSENEEDNMLPKVKLQDLKKTVNVMVELESTFFRQINALRREVQITKAKEKKILELIHNDLSCALNAQSPKSKFYFFGSRITRLYIHGSNLDVYVNNSFLEIKQVLLKCRSFDKIVTTASEEVTCRHTLTNMTCTIYPRNKLAIKRSHLIKYYLRLDEKLSPLMLTLKYWAKICDLLNEGKFSQYALDLLILFYLQQVPLRLPSVESIQERVPWDLERGFSPVVSYGIQNVTVLDLVKGFFKFYDTFDYISFMIAPSTGEAVQKPNSNTHIYIQDPFEPETNVLGNSSSICGGKFTSLCRNSLECFEKGESQLLYNLLNVVDSRKIFIPKPVRYTEEQWLNLVAKALTEILTKIFLCEKIIEFAFTTKRVNCRYSGSYDVLNNRLGIAKGVSSELGKVDKEIAVSSTILEKNKKIVPWSVVLKLTCASNNVQVCIEGGFGLKTDFDHFLRLVTMEMVEEILEGKRQIQVEEESKGDITTPDNAYEPDLPFFEHLSHILEPVPTFLEQVTLLQKDIGKSKEETERRQEIIRDLTITLDCFSYLGEIHFFDNTTLYFKNNKKADSRVLKEIERALSNSENFSQVSCFFSSETVMFTHDSTNSYCSLLLKNNQLFTFSKKLMDYYRSLDDKIEPLFYLVELWGSYYDLAKTSFVSNYALNLMIVFFLQREFNFPSVIDLQENVTPVVVEGWNCGFKAVKFANSSLRKLSLLELVEKFFNFYLSFDYISYVVAPYCGALIEKVDFLQPFNLPSYYSDYVDRKEEMVVNMGLCVQDVFQHSRNLTFIPAKMFGRFSALCKCVLSLLDRGRERLLNNLLTHGFDSNLLQCYEFSVPKERLNDEEMKNLVKRVLTEILGGDCDQLTNEGLVVFNFNGKYNFWENRVKTLKKMDFVQEFDREISTTARLLQENPKVNYILSVELNLTRNSYEILIPLTKKKAFAFHMAHFFYTRLVKLLPEEEKLLEESDVANMIVSPLKSYLTDEFPKKMKEEEYEIPSDFFDDFSDNEFLNSLEESKRDKKKKKVTSRRRTPDRRRARSRSVPKRRVRSRSRQRMHKVRREIIDGDRRKEPVKKKSFLEELHEKLVGPKQKAPSLRPIGNSAEIQPYDISFFVQPQDYSNTFTNVKYTEDHISKLFFGSKISISDYLTIRRKQEGALFASGNIQKKIQVLKLCYDTIRVMSYPEINPFRIKPSPETQTKTSKHQSPLHKSTSKFKFTSKLTKREPSDVFSDTLYMILRMIGVLKTETDVEKLIESVAESLLTGMVMDSEVAARILQISLLGYKISDEDDEETVQVGTQHGSVSVGTQIEEDFYKNDILSESIACLTKAYLLGRESGHVASASF